MKKIIALTAALALIIFTCAVPVFSADDDMTLEEYSACQNYLISQYINGEISFTDFQVRSGAITDEFTQLDICDPTSVLYNPAALQAANTVIAIEYKFENTAKNAISGVLDDLFDPYKTTSEVSGSGINVPEGCGVLKKVSSDGWYYIYYGYELGQLYYNGNEISAYLPYNRYELYRPSGDLYSSYDLESSVNVSYKTLHDGEYVNDTGVYIFGTWTWRGDETPAETDDTYETVDGYDFSQATDDELVDLLNDILEALENANPDLSSIEGLLKAIYYRLGTLDSDNDNALLSQIAAAISAIDNDNSDIVKTLEDIKSAISADFDSGNDDLEDSGGEDLEEYREKILAYLYPGEEELTEAQEFATNVKGLFLTKFGFIEEFKNFFSNLQWGSDSSFSLDLTFNGKSYPMEPSGLENLAEIVRYMLAFFIYGSFAIRAYKRMPEIIATGGGDE